MVMVGLARGELRHFHPSQITMVSLGAFVYLVLIGGIVGYVSYAWLLRYCDPSKVATYAFVNPVVAVILGAALAGEKLSIGTAVAAAIIIGSVALVIIAGRRPATPTPEVACPEALMTTNRSAEKRLFRPQRRHRTDPGRAPRGQPGREQGCRDEHERREREGERIDCAHLIENAAKQCPGRDREQQPNDNTGREHDRAFAQDHPLHGPALRAERHANADLACASRDRVGFHAIDTDDGENQCKAAEGAEQRRTGADDPKLQIAVEM